MVISPFFKHHLATFYGPNFYKFALILQYLLSIIILRWKKEQDIGLHSHTHTHTVQLQREWERGRGTSSMQNKEAALTNVAGTTIQLQSSQSMMGSVRCHNTRNLEVKRVYERGIGIPMICSQTPIPSWKQETFDSCKF